MLPSTKIYELFVYANIVKQIGGRVEEICGSRLALKVNSSRLYFNHYPRTMLRLIKDLTKRIPSPDILYVSKDLTIPIECKYRDLSKRKLRLGDAERLLSYIVDASRNGDFTTIITSLSKPREKEVKTSIDGRNIKVVFVEFNPNTKIENIASILERIETTKRN